MSPKQVEEAEKLNRSGLSLQKIGDRLSFTAHTVRARLLEREVAMRDIHGRDR